LIFNSNGKSQGNEITINGNIIQIVPKYCYLGVILKCNGRFNLATTVLIEKARKACFKMKRIIGFDNQCKLLEKLFDAMVLPVLHYCSEIWGVDLSSNDISRNEKFHLKFIKDPRGSVVRL
jgi:hypothetical protein